MSNLLEGKKVLILGVANERSIAWGIAKAMKENGAKVALSYLNEQLQKRVDPLAKEIDAEFTFPLDVTNDSDIDALKGLVEDKWGTVDIVIHSLAFADREDLKGRFVETSRAGFKMAMDISAYSLIAVCQSLKDCFSENASVMAMTYHGSQQVIQGYNVMGVAKAALEANCRYLASDLGKDGVRVNCISAGPIRTLAASGVPGLRDIFKVVEERAPLGRNIDQMDVGKTSVYLASDLASGVTGQILYVDSGMSTMAL